MNKLLITLCLAASFMLSGCYNSGEPREKVLKIYNWADYIGDGVLEDFQAYYKEQTGEDIRIVYQTFDINEIMLTKIEKGHEDFDVVCFGIHHRADVEERLAVAHRHRFSPFARLHE